MADGKEGSGVSHDHNFKNLILDYPREALEFFAAAEAQRLEGARITPLRQEQMQERLGERFRELDTPLLVEWPNGEREALVFVVEEESTPGRFSIHRLIHYCVDLAELLKTNRVVPVVIFLRPGDPPASLELAGDDGVYLRFRYIAADLGRIPASVYMESRNIVARLNLPNFAYRPGGRVAVYVSAVTGLLELEEGLELHYKYLRFIDDYGRLEAGDREQVRRELHEYAKRHGNEEKIMTGLSYWWEEKGRVEGLREGVVQGESLLLQRMLRRRFGDLPPWAEDRLTKACNHDLELWADRILDARQLEDVFDETRH